MTTIEILLILAVIVLLLLQTQLLKWVRQPLYTYFNLAIDLVLLFLVWVIAGDGSLPLQIIITAVVIKNVVKTIQEYKVFTKNPNSTIS